MISPTALAPQLAEYLPRQRWFGAKDRTIDFVRIRSTETLSGADEWPVLLRVDAEVHLEGTDVNPAAARVSMTSTSGLWPSVRRRKTLRIMWSS